MNDSTTSGRVTALLRDWRAGNRSAVDELISLVYDELRLLARLHLRREAVGHTLRPTALVHEAYRRLVDAEISWEDRSHFFAVAATAIRRVLVDHARARGRVKRGGGAVHVTLQPQDAADTSPDPIDILLLDQTLGELAEFDPRKARLVELHYFAGLTHEESAHVTGVSVPTVRRDLRLARAWLGKALS